MLVRVDPCTTWHVPAPDCPGGPPMTELTTSINASRASDTTVPVQLRTRVVREARRETWFVVNEGAEDLATIPLELRGDGALRRVEVNGEAAEFASVDEVVHVTPRRPLRAGAGTLVILHFR